MSKPLQSTTLAAPGFFGLNTQESGITIASGFALEANNCIIDKFGRIGSRKGWTKYSNASGSVTGEVRAIGEHTETDGSLTVLFTANNKLWKLDSNSDPVELTPQSATITAATQANPCSITATAHGFVTGNSVTITGVVGMTELNGNSYTITVVDANTFTLNSTDSSGFTAYTSGGTATKAAITITDDDWQIISYNNVSVFVQQDHTMVYYDGSVNEYFEFTNAPGSTTPSTGASCFNRAWVADDFTVYWSKILEPDNFSGVGSGFINMREVFGEDDKVVAVTEYNNRLVIFGKRNIAFFAGAEDPTSVNFVMTDHISGIGCIARDSVASVGTDVVFLSADGVRSVGRVIQEQSAPLTDISKNVRDDIVQFAQGEAEFRIKAVYSPRDAFYLITFPSTGFVYCFDMRAQLQDGSRRTTLWTDISPSAFLLNRNNELLLGQTAYVAKYDGFTDDTTKYRLSYYTNYFDFDSATVEKILKNIRIALIGATNQEASLKWGFDYSVDYFSTSFELSGGSAVEYGSAEYGLNTIVSGNIVGTQSSDTITVSVDTATISAATQANPCSITATAHGFSTGDLVLITGVVGMTQLNDNTFTITKVDANTFTLDSTDSSAYTAYTSGGTATKLVHYDLDFQTTQDGTYNTEIVAFLDTDTFYYSVQNSAENRTATSLYFPASAFSSEYSEGIVLDNISLSLSGRGAVLQIGIEADIDGGALSIQKLDIFAKTGKLVI